MGEADDGRAARDGEADDAVATAAAKWSGPADGDADDAVATAGVNGCGKAGGEAYDVAAARDGSLAGGETDNAAAARYVWGFGLTVSRCGCRGDELKFPAQ